MIEPAPAASSAPGLTVSVLRAGDYAVLAVSGWVDMQTAPILTDHIAEVLDARPRGLVIDLTDVDFLASAGLESLLSAHRRGGATPVVVVADGPATSRPIVLTGIDKAIALFPTRAEAIRSLDG